MKDKIKKYIEQTQICFQTDYSDKKSVRENNRAVDMMYEIVREIEISQNAELKNEFVGLLEIENEQESNLWAAIHLLECLSVEHHIKEKALKIVEKYAQGDSVKALGLQYWLNDYKKSL